jgi:hypothetical protein
MANDYQTLLNVIGQLIPNVSRDQLAIPAGFATNESIAATNRISFGDPTGSAPITMSNLDLLNQANANIVNPGGSNAIFTNQQGTGANVTCKVIFNYQVNSQGFSETLYYNGMISAITPAVLVPVVKARMGFSGAQTQFLSVSVRTIGTRFAAFNQSWQQLNWATPANVPQFGTYTPSGSTDTDTDVPATACLVNCASSTRGRRMFVRGIPDLIFGRGGVFIGTGVFAAQFAKWVAILTANAPNSVWGWWGQGVNPRYNITGFTDTAGQLNIVFGGNIFPLPTPPATYQNTPIRLRGLPHPFAYFNGPMVVLPTSQTACTSIRVFPFPPVATLEITTAQGYLQAGSQFYPFNTMGIASFASTRRPGRPSSEHRGRQRNRQWS